jgi:hypothetical protein
MAGTGLCLCFADADSLTVWPYRSVDENRWWPVNQQAAETKEWETR